MRRIEYSFQTRFVLVCKCNKNVNELILEGVKSFQLKLSGQGVIDKVTVTHLNMKPRLKSIDLSEDNKNLRISFEHATTNPDQLHSIVARIDAIWHEHIECIIIYLSHLSFIDSMMARLLALLRDRVANNADGALIAIAPHKTVKALLKMFHLDQFVKIVNLIFN